MTSLYGFPSGVPYPYRCPCGNVATCVRGEISGAPIFGCDACHDHEKDVDPEEHPELKGQQFAPGEVTERQCEALEGDALDEAQAVFGIRLEDAKGLLDDALAWLPGAHPLCRYEIKAGLARCELCDAMARARVALERASEAWRNEEEQRDAEETSSEVPT